MRGIVTAYLHGQPEVGFDGLADGWLTGLGIARDGAGAEIAALLVDRIERYIGSLARQAVEALSAVAGQIGNLLLAPRDRVPTSPGTSTASARASRRGCLRDAERR